MEILGYVLIVIGILFYGFVLMLGFFMADRLFKGRDGFIFTVIMLVCTFGIVVASWIMPGKQTATIELSNNTVIQCHDIDLGEQQ